MLSQAKTTSDPAVELLSALLRSDVPGPPYLRKREYLNTNTPHWTWSATPLLIRSASLRTASTQTPVLLTQSKMLTYFAFSNLLPELQLRTCTLLPRHNLRSLSRTSRHFFSLTSRDLLIRDLQHHCSNQTLLCCLKYPTSSPTPSTPHSPYIYPKRRSLQIEQDPGPFVIRDVEIGTSTDASCPGPINLHIYKPVFLRPDSNERPLDVRIDLSAVSLARPKPTVPSFGAGTATVNPMGPVPGVTGATGAIGVGDVVDNSISNGGPEGGPGVGDPESDVAESEGRKDDEWSRRDATRDEIIEFGASVYVSGKLALLTARMLRASYTCPECRGARFLKRPAEKDMFHMRCVPPNSPS